MTFNKENWGPENDYGMYTKHPFIEKTLNELFNSDDEDYEGVVVQGVRIEAVTEKGYAGTLHTNEFYDGLHFYAENDETIKILSPVPGDNRGCYIIRDIFISSGHDGFVVYDAITGEDIQDCTH